MTGADVAGRHAELRCSAEARQYQKRFGAQLRSRVVEQGEPFVLAQADTPHEIFHTLDIPIVSNQWWAAYISAKQLSSRYFRVLDEHGFPGNRCNYCSLGLACSLANDPQSAPWGGLPRPTLLIARLTCDCIQPVFTEWARVLQSEFFPLEAPGWSNSLAPWFHHSRDRWEEVFQDDRIALLTAEMRELIDVLERRTGREFSRTKFRKMMERINEQERYLSEAAVVAGAARPCPVSIVDQMHNTMIPQWHRGSDWAVAHARRFRDEIRDRVNRKIGFAKNERLRLMWIGSGLWHDTGFYDALEARLGAVFVWSMYLPFAGVQYFRELRGRPLEALASRVCSMNEVLHLPPWMSDWFVAEAARCGIDAAVMLMPPNNRLAQSGTLLARAELQAAGIPVFLAEADMVDPRNWDRDAVVDRIENYLRRECLS